MTDKDSLLLPSEIWVKLLSYSNKWPTTLNYRNVCHQLRSIIDRTDGLSTLNLEKCQQLMGARGTTVEDQANYILNTCCRVFTGLYVNGHESIPAVRLVVNCQVDKITELYVSHCEMSYQMAQLIGEFFNLKLLQTEETMGVQIDLSNLTRLETLKGGHCCYVNCSARLQVLHLEGDVDYYDSRDLIRTVRMASQSLIELNLTCSRHLRQPITLTTARFDIDMTKLRSLVLSNQMYTVHMKLNLTGAKSLSNLHLGFNTGVQIKNFNMGNHILTKLMLANGPLSSDVFSRLIKADAKSLNRLETVILIDISQHTAIAVMNSLADNCASLATFAIVLQGYVAIRDFNVCRRLIVNAKSMQSIYCSMSLTKNELIELILSKVSLEQGTSFVLALVKVTNSSFASLARDLLNELRAANPLIERRRRPFHVFVKCHLSDGSDDEASDDVSEEYGIELQKR